MKTQPKSINALMKYMREQKNIEISGSVQKRNLRNMGYFHGYKGYRFCKRPERKFEYTNFDELQAIYDFDMDIKATVYSPLMSLETALKNYCFEIFNS
ncbi:Abi family protein [uncultured Pseudoramibacter sp.]|uniref:Abi family protein n=1 Tax=uncultured Pseudoramibacter sp. TaxID=1623493 RepID=UPI0025EB0982|nr:Abi family protein [uncultured Pseudoramibacter sp.]